MTVSMLRYTTYYNYNDIHHLHVSIIERPSAVKCSSSCDASIFCHDYCTGCLVQQTSLLKSRPIVFNVSTLSLIFTNCIV